jgi:hypothetical protein
MSDFTQFGRMAEVRLVAALLLQALGHREEAIFLMQVRGATVCGRRLR